MADFRKISGNTIGKNAIFVQGDFNTTDAGSFLNNISKTDPYYDKKRILEAKGPLLHESFSWILDHEGFQKWRYTKESGVLWIKGDPGKGKTMLLCGIIEDLEKNPGTNTNLGYFFCQATDSRINSAASVVAGLIFSLVNKRGHNEQHTALLESLRNKYTDTLNELEGPNTYTVLCDIFKTVTQDAAMLDPVCIVDALDECEHNCKALLNLIVSTSTHVKWLLSSRNVKDIERDLRKIESNRRLSLELKANAKNISKSVDAYIDNSIQDIEALEGNNELQIQTTETLKSKADGTFLWVALVVEQLRGTDRRNVEDVLKEIPAGLENLYRLIMQRVYSKLRPKDQEACRVLLSIITTAERPLHLKELRLFISFQWADYKSTYEIRDIQDIVKDLGSLLYIRDDAVYFIHQSAKEYIVDSTTTSTFPLGIEYQHYQMARTSLEAMCHTLKYDICDLKNPESELYIYSAQIPDQLRSIAYSCVYWVEHLVRGCSSERPTAEDLSKYDDILHSFLTTKYLCWLESLALLRSLEPHGVVAIEKLRNWAVSSYGNKTDDHLGLKGDENCLMSFIGDAYDFFHSCKGYVNKLPLQLYYSAIVFENESSAIYKTFRQSVQAHFRNSLTIIKKPRARLLLRRDISIQQFVDKLVYSWDSSALCVLSYSPNLDSHIMEVYRTDTMKQTAVWKTDNKNHYASFLPNSKQLISVSSVGIVQTWNIDNKAQLQRRSLNLNVNRLQIGYQFREVPQEEVISLSPHGDLAASTCLTNSGYNVSLVKIWTTETCTCACQIDLMHTSTERENLHAFFAPNSALIALIHKDDARIYSAQTGEEMKHIQAPNTMSVAYKKCSKFSQDSALLALVHDKGYKTAADSIYLWCSKTWTMTRWIRLDTMITDLDLSPDASLFAVVSDWSLIVGSTGTGQQLFNIEASYDISKILFSPDWPNSSLLASTHINKVRIWKADVRDTSAELHNAAHPPSSVIISPGLKYVAAQSLAGCINIWSGDSGESVQMLKGGGRSNGRPLFSPNSELIACEDEGRFDVRIWRVDSGEIIHKLRGPNQLVRSKRLHKIFSEDSKYLFIGHKDWQVKVWCMDSGKCLFETDGREFGPFPSDVSLAALAISRDSKYLAAAHGGDNWAVCIWDWGTSHHVSTIPRPPSDPRKLFFPTGGLDFIGVTFSSDATALAVICKTRRRDPEYEVQIWEIATGIRLARVAAGESYSLPLFNPITNQILTDRAVFCKTSSWDCWHKSAQLPRRRYSICQEITGKLWLCCNGEKVFYIPDTPQLACAEGQSAAVSDLLLAYSTPVKEIMIIRLPSF